MLGIIINNDTEAAEMLRGYFSRALKLKGRMSPLVWSGKGKVRGKGRWSCMGAEVARQCPLRCFEVLQC